MVPPPSKVSESMPTARAFPLCEGEGGGGGGIIMTLCMVSESEGV